MIAVQNLYFSFSYCHERATRHLRVRKFLFLLRMLLSSQRLQLPTVLLVDKDVSVLDVTLVHERDDLVDLVHRSLLNPRLDLVLDGEVQHLGDQRRGALMTSGEIRRA